MGDCCFVAAEQAAGLRRELDDAKLAHGEAQGLLKVAGDELANYKRRICDLEGYVSLKEQDLELQRDLLKKQETTIQQLAEPKSDVVSSAKQWEKRYCGLESASLRQCLCSVFFVHIVCLSCNVF